MYFRPEETGLTRSPYRLYWKIIFILGVRCVASSRAPAGLTCDFLRRTRIECAKITSPISEAYINWQWVSYKLSIKFPSYDCTLMMSVDSGYSVKDVR